ncbi:MAG: ABC transporter ATP-binding protein [Candidatus Firestonebacteria bacterium]
MVSVEVKSLTKMFGKFTAVDNVSFSINRGEIFGFLGPNGAGKSTTIKMLCGILSPTSGEGLVEDFDISKDSDEIKKIIGYMSQKFSLYNDLTVEENINFYGGIHNVGKAEMLQKREWILNMAGLKGKEKVLTGVLSGGWRQRLALGCAIVHNPKVVFLDEPTAGVDPISRRDFWNLIKKLSENGTTVFVTTHYMDEAEYCGRISLIYNGKLIEIGSPYDLKDKYKTKSLDKLFVKLIREYDL